MTAFIVNGTGIQSQRHLVRDAQCIGKKCLVLGVDSIREPFICFPKNRRMTRPFYCCLRMTRRGCPMKEKFDYSERLKNVKDGFYVRLI
jgi:hypothetical protein